MTSTEAAPLAGKRVLLLEDEALVALLAEEMLVDLGAEVVGPAFTLAEGMRLAREGVLDAALLDVNIAGKRSLEVAQVLQGRGVPLVFATGESRLSVQEFPDAWLLEKPYTQVHLAEALLKALGV